MTTSARLTIRVKDGVAVVSVPRPYHVSDERTFAPTRARLLPEILRDALERDVFQMPVSFQFDPPRAEDEMVTGLRFEDE